MRPNGFDFFGSFNSSLFPNSRVLTDARPGQQLKKKSVLFSNLKKDIDVDGYDTVRDSIPARLWADLDERAYVAGLVELGEFSATAGSALRPFTPGYGTLAELQKSEGQSSVARKLRRFLVEPKFLNLQLVRRDVDSQRRYIARLGKKERNPALQLVDVVRGQSPAASALYRTAFGSLRRHFMRRSWSSNLIDFRLPRINKIKILGNGVPLFGRYNLPDSRLFSPKERIRLKAFVQRPDRLYVRQRQTRFLKKLKSSPKTIKSKSKIKLLTMVKAKRLPSEIYGVDNGYSSRRTHSRIKKMVRTVGKPILRGYRYRFFWTNWVHLKFPNYCAFTTSKPYNFPSTEGNLGNSRSFSSNVPFFLALASSQRRQYFWKFSLAQRSQTAQFLQSLGRGWSTYEPRFGTVLATLGLHVSGAVRKTESFVATLLSVLLANWEALSVASPRRRQKLYPFLRRLLALVFVRLRVHSLGLQIFQSFFRSSLTPASKFSKTFPPLDYFKFIAPLQLSLRRLTHWLTGFQANYFGLIPLNARLPLGQIWESGPLLPFLVKANSYFVASELPHDLEDGLGRSAADLQMAFAAMNNDFMTAEEFIMYRDRYAQLRRSFRSGLVGAGRALVDFSMRRGRVMVGHWSRLYFLRSAALNRQRLFILDAYRLLGERHRRRLVVGR